MSTATMNPAEIEAKRLMEESLAKHRTNPTGNPLDLGIGNIEGEPGVKAYSPWQKRLTDLAPRRDQAFFDYNDQKGYKEKGVYKSLSGFTPGAGTDAIRWAAMAANSKNMSGGNPIERMDNAIKASGDLRMAQGMVLLKRYLDTLDSQTKALVESSMVDGGALVPPEFSSEFIYLLRAGTVILEGGASTVQMKGQILNMPRQNGAATAFYEGETQAVTPSQQQFGQLSFIVHKLMALTPVSNDLLHDGGPDIEAIVRDDLVQVMALRQDLAWLTGNGTNGSTMGLTSLINTLNNLTATQGGSSASFQEIAYDVGRMIAALKNANVDKFAKEDSWVWFMSPRSEQYLRTVASSFGVFPFKDGMDNNGEFFGIKYLTTTAIVNNQGTGGNASNVFLVAAPAMVVAQNMPLELKVYPDGTAPDLNGTIISGISSDMTWLRAKARHDFQLRYDLAAANLTNTLWGT